MDRGIQQYFRSLERDAIPQLSINCVIFGFQEKCLQVIVNRISMGSEHILVLPGGYVNQRENVVDAVERIVRDSTGLEKMLFKQFAVFGDASRSFKKEFALVFEHLKEVSEKDLRWISQRFISICYLALVDYSKITLRPTRFFETAEWLPMRETEKLGLDHPEIVKSARESLAKEVPHQPIASHLLPSTFTLPDLHKLFEEILNRNIDRPNFRRKILNSNLIVKVGTDDSGKRRPADLYKFKHGAETNLSDGYKFGF